MEAIYSGYLLSKENRGTQHQESTDISVGSNGIVVSSMDRWNGYVDTAENILGAYHRLSNFGRSALRLKLERFSFYH